MSYRAIRGGSVYVSWGLRSSDRIWNEPERRYWDYGFRLIVRSAA